MMAAIIVFLVVIIVARNGGIDSGAGNINRRADHSTGHAH